MTYITCDILETENCRAGQPQHYQHEFKVEDGMDTGDIKTPVTNVYTMPDKHNECFWTVSTFQRRTSLTETGKEVYQTDFQQAVTGFCQVEKADQKCKL